MDTSRNEPAGALGYVVALIGAVGFVISCFIPFLAMGGLSPAATPVTLYGLFTRFPGHTAYRVGGLLILFGGVAIVSLVAIIGIARPSFRSWARRALLFVAILWAVERVGYLLVYHTMSGVRAGFWCLVASVAVVVCGALLAEARADRNGRRPRSDEAATGDPRAGG
jgi:hypothetical protein